MIRIIGAELHQHDAPALGKQLEFGSPLGAQSIHDASFEAFKANRLKAENFGNVVRGDKRIADIRCQPVRDAAGWG